jgi:hypothetical protein
MLTILLAIGFDIALPDLALTSSMPKSLSDLFSISSALHPILAMISYLLGFRGAGEFLDGILRLWSAP